jgi:hypothetical protein
VAASTARARLRAAVSSSLVPALRSAGFEGPASIKGNALLHEYRRRSSTGTHVLRIVFEKHQRPRFALNFYAEPPEGMEHVISRGGTVIAGALKAKKGPYTRHWFRADRPWWQRVLLRQRETMENDAVALCLSLLPEVESWWTTLSPSTHINSWQVKYRGTRGT